MDTYRKQRFIKESSTEFDNNDFCVYSLYYNLYTIQYLVTKGININKLIKNNLRRDVITVYGNLQLVKYLIDLGISFQIASDLSIKQIVERNKLYLLKIIFLNIKIPTLILAMPLIESNYFSILKYHIKKIISANNTTTITALIFAMKNDTFKVFKYFIDNTKLSVENIHTIFYNAIENNKLPAIDYLINKCKLDNESIENGLNFAKCNKCFAAIELLTKYKK